MPKFLVHVQRRQTITGTIEVESRNDLAALQEVNRRMSNNLQTTDPSIVWDEPTYDECSFEATGDVDQI